MNRYPLPCIETVKREIEESDKYLKLAMDYIDNPNEYVRKIQTVVNGKIRNLITYQPTAKGGELRRMHLLFSEYLRKRYKTADSSFAYVKGKSFLDCANRHLTGTAFLKLDIHNYFNSISQERMLDRIHNLNTKNISIDRIDLLTKACFYENYLPIGFVSSPVLSDLFLVNIDRKYQKKRGIVYTRYADDFILSVETPDWYDVLAKVKESLVSDLGKLGLEINYKKTYIRGLSQPGDAIRLLGVNIVKTEKKTNKITVSDRYLRTTCWNLGQILTHNVPDGDLQNQISRVCGQVNFIRQCSCDSYAKFRKMVYIKCRYYGEFDVKSILRKVEG